MAAVGLIYVGAVLFLNGAMLLGWVEARPRRRSTCSSGSCRSSPRRS
ncbi:AmiS/UreI family transporter [Pseudonocardia benzenivorans]